MSTFDLQDFINMVNGANGISRVIRMPLLSKVADVKLRDELQSGNVELDEIVVASIADV